MMPVLFAEFFPDPVSLASWCDVLTVCLRADSSTYHIIDSAVLDALGPEGYVVNISRGIAIDEAVLIDYLKQRKIAGAGLDVFEHEPKISEELLKIGQDITGESPVNIVLTPHLGGFSSTAHGAMSNMVLENVKAFLERSEIPHPVPEMKEMAKTWRWPGPAGVSS